MFKAPASEEFEIVFFENSDKAVKRPITKELKQPDNSSGLNNARLTKKSESVHALTTTDPIKVGQISTKSASRLMNKEFNEVTEFINQVLMEKASPSVFILHALSHNAIDFQIGLTLNSSLIGVNLGAERIDSNGNSQMKELLCGYLQKDRLFYNKMHASDSKRPVPQEVGPKSIGFKGFSEHIEKSLNEMLMEGLEGTESPTKPIQNEANSSPTNTQQIFFDNSQHKQNMDLFEIREDTSSAHSSLPRDTANKENSNILQHQELALDEVQEVIDAEYSESDMSYSRSHKMPYVIAEKKSSSRLWKQAFEQPSQISIKDVKFIKPSRSKTPQGNVSRDTSQLFKGDRDGSFTISKPVIREIPKPELQMDQSMRIVGKPARNVYELSPISTQRKLGEIWTQDGVKVAESFYSPANVSKMYDKTRKGGKSPTTANTSTISANNCARNPTNYSFRANESNAPKKTAEKKVVGDAGKRYKLPVEPKTATKGFVPHHEKERLKQCLKQLKHSLLLES